MEVIRISNEGDFTEFEYSEPLNDVIELQSFIDKVSEHSTFNKQFAWSNDKKTYSSWILLTNANLQTVKPINDSPVFLKFKYTLVTGANAEISDIEIFFTSSIPSSPNIIPKSYKSNGTLCKTNQGTAKGLIFNKSCETFNPYMVNPAIDFYTDMMYAVNKQFGIPSQYFKAIADKRSEDVIFMEESLFGVSDCKDVKIMVPNNEFPDSIPTYNQWGINFEHPFEIHIVKENFQEIFGRSSSPQKRDIIFIPIMNRLFDVISSYMVKDFMQRDAYWKVNLRKHQNKSNVYKSESVETLIDELTTSAEKVFGKKLTKDLEDLTNNQQYSRTSSLGIADTTRFAKSPDLHIKQIALKNNATIIAENSYENFRGAKIIPDALVSYKSFVEIAENTEHAFTCWFRHKDFQFLMPKERVHELSFNSNLTIRLGKSINFEAGTELMFHRAGISFYGTVISHNGNEYTLELNNNVLQNIRTIDPNWEVRNDWACEFNDTKILLDGYQDNKGIRIELKARRFVVITLDDETNIGILQKNINDDWQAIVINISKKYRQIDINLWTIDQDIKSTDLLNIEHLTIPNISNSDTINNEKRYSIMSGTFMQTNIRILKEKIKTEEQSLFLNQNIIKDASKAIVIDNALPEISLPFFGSAK